MADARANLRPFFFRVRTQGSWMSGVPRTILGGRLRCRADSDVMSTRPQPRRPKGFPVMLSPAMFPTLLLLLAAAPSISAQTAPVAAKTAAQDPTPAPVPDKRP